MALAVLAVNLSVLALDDQFGLLVPGELAAALKGLARVFCFDYLTTLD